MSIDYITAAGAISFGLLIGWMVYRTFTRQEKLDAKFLGSIIALMAGGAVVAFFQKLSPSKQSLPRELWFYPMGLLAGDQDYGVHKRNRAKAGAAF